MAGLNSLARMNSRSGSARGAHRAATYRQPADVLTGANGDDRLDDEFSWATAELLINTGRKNTRPFAGGLDAKIPTELGRRASAGLDIACLPSQVPAWPCLALDRFCLQSIVDPSFRTVV
jgi:hypothetical protein